MTCVSVLPRFSQPFLAAAFLVLMAGLHPAARADVKVPAIFGSHMVLQRDQKDRVWGWAEPGEEVTVKIGGQSHTTKAGADGSWQVVLDPMPAGGPHTLDDPGQEHAQARRRARGRGLDLLGAVEHAVVRRRCQGRRPRNRDGQVSRASG